MKIDFKISTWERAEIPEEFEDQVIKATKQGKITSINDLNNFLDKINKNKNDFIEWEVLHDTKEYLNPEDNDGQSAVEIVDDTDNIVWRNGKDISEW